MIKNTGIIVALGVIVLLLVGIYVFKGKGNQNVFMTTSNQEVGENVDKESAESDQAEIEMVEIRSGNYFFEPNEITVKGPKITIKVAENSGIHTFVIDELGVKENLKSGMEFSFEAEPGIYTFYCDIGNHRQLGMEGMLVVE